RREPKVDLEPPALLLADQRQEMLRSRTSCVGGHVDTSSHYGHGGSMWPSASACIWTSDRSVRILLPSERLSQGAREVCWRRESLRYELDAMIAAVAAAEAACWAASAAAPAVDWPAALAAVATIAMPVP